MTNWANRANWIIQTKLRLQALLNRQKLERDLDDEMAFHLTMRDEKNQAQGNGPTESLTEARRQFGNAARFKEACRELWTFAWIEVLRQDLRYGVRALVKNPGFSLVVVLTLALGIGASTAMFSVVYSVLLRPLHFSEPEKLVALVGNNRSQGFADSPVSAGDFYDWKSQNEVFSSVTAFAKWPLNLTGTEEPERITSALVTPDFFAVLGVRPDQGRWFLPDEDQAAKSDVVVVSHQFWARIFGPSTTLAGQTLTLGGSKSTIVGIMPTGFSFPDKEVEVWVPLSLSAANRQNHEGRWLTALGRLKPGMQLETAQKNMDVITQRLQQQYPASNAGWNVALAPLQAKQTGSLRTRLLVLLGAVGLILLVACSNVASLLLARAAGRSREIATRVAIGAGRLRIVCQLLTENFVLAFIAGAAGVALAYWTVGAVRVGIARAIPALSDVAISGPALGFAAVVSLLTVVLFGLAPALQATSADLQQSLRSVTNRSGLGFKARKFLVVSQVAVAVVLLAGAGLLTKSFLRLVAVDPGFNPHNAVAMKLDLPRSKYRTNEQHVAFFQQVLERVRAVPGVEQAGAVSDPPLLQNSMEFKVVLEGHDDLPSDKLPRAGVRWVTPGYFAAMQIPVLKGRVPQEQDTASAPLVAMINRSMARQFWPNTDPVGAKIRLEEDPRWFSILGVVDDIKQIELDKSEVPALYLPHAQKSQAWMNWMTLVVRSSAAPETQLAAIRAQIHAVDKDQAISKVATLEKYVGDNVLLPKFSSAIVGGFSAMALLVALVGLYGLIAYSVSRRTHEIGIRMALGAEHSNVLQLVLGEGARLVMAGLATGLLAAFLLARLMTTLLYEVRASDPLTLIEVVFAVLVMALVACYIPARRATRINPIVALRHE